MVMLGEFLRKQEINILFLQEVTRHNFDTFRGYGLHQCGYVNASYSNDNEDIPVVREAIQCYERASEARLNTRKSKTLAVGEWDYITEVLDIPYCDEIQIVGFSIASTVEKLSTKRWTKITARAREQAREAYGRVLCLS